MGEVTLPRPGARAQIRPWLRDRGVYVALAVLVLFNALFTDNFLTVDSLRLQFVQVAPIMIVALGMALVIGTEGIDLSVGAVMAISAATLPAYLGYGAWPAVAVAILAGGLVGVVNGGLVAFVGIQPIVATLGMLVAGRGIALVIADGRLTEIFDPTLDRARHRQRRRPAVHGAHRLPAGGAGRRAGAADDVRAPAGRDRRQPRARPCWPACRSVARWSLVYVLTAALAAVAGVLETARVGASDPSFVGLLIELSAITAVVVGGTPLSGGRVRILGTVAGALLMQLITATLIRHDLPDSSARMIQAAIIVAAVYVQRDRGAA